MFIPNKWMRRRVYKKILKRLHAKGKSGSNVYLCLYIRNLFPWVKIGYYPELYDRRPMKGTKGCIQPIYDNQKRIEFVEEALAML